MYRRDHIRTVPTLHLLGGYQLVYCGVRGGGGGQYSEMSSLKTMILEYDHMSQSYKPLKFYLVTHFSTRVWPHISAQRFGHTFQHKGLATHFSNKGLATHFSTRVWPHISAQGFGHTFQHKGLATHFSTRVWPHISAQGLPFFCWSGEWHKHAVLFVAPPPIC